MRFIHSHKPSSLLPYGRPSSLPFGRLSALPTELLENILLAANDWKVAAIVEAIHAHLPHFYKDAIQAFEEIEVDAVFRITTQILKPTAIRKENGDQAMEKIQDQWNDMFEMTPWPIFNPFPFITLEDLLLWEDGEPQLHIVPVVPYSPITSLDLFGWTDEFVQSDRPPSPSTNTLSLLESTMILRHPQTSSTPFDVLISNIDSISIVTQFFPQIESRTNLDSIIKRAAEAGNLSILQYVMKDFQGSQVIEYAADQASSQGNLEVLKWLGTHKACEFSTRTVDLATSNGHLEVLKWLHARTPAERFHNLAFSKACENGHLDIVKWWIKHGLIDDDDGFRLGEVVCCNSFHLAEIVWQSAPNVLEYFLENKSRLFRQIRLDEALGLGQFRDVKLVAMFAEQRCLLRSRRWRMSEMERSRRKRWRRVGGEGGGA
ncbi:hypothetical protein HDU97_003790 [Phlyctochytrium planicorne]|nr:hypothetical protein HDU97_003790 [Phlyctochytrium planicorne]